MNTDTTDNQEIGGLLGGYMSKEPTIESSQDNMPKEEGVEKEEPSTSDSKDGDSKENQEAKPKSDQEKPKEEDILQELEKAKKISDDNRKHAHSLSTKASRALKAIDSLVEEGELSDDIAEKIKSHYEGFDSIDDKEGSSPKNDSVEHRISDFILKAQPELSSYMDIAEDPEIEMRAKAFHFYLTHSSLEQRKSLLASLEKQGDDSKATLKEMLKVGKSFLEEDGGRALIEAGGYQALVKKQAEEIKSLQKQLDKTKKDHENYNESTKSYGKNVNTPRDLGMVGGYRA